MPAPARPRTAAERMRRYRARRRAAGLRQIRSWAPVESTWSEHRVADARSLAMHVLAARRIASDPARLDRARQIVARWLAQREEPPAALKEWRHLLERPWQEVAACATALTEDGARLRQSSPFAALLTPAERRRIHDAFRA